MSKKESKVVKKDRLFELYIDGEYIASYTTQELAEEHLLSMEDDKKETGKTEDTE